ncbi:hypothetical protein BSKO_09581 [Bryopsis sp. KO-2023]|nr:hypothetical protein BSKO_09581 [Bryopsis sp. KO-2023]
MMRLAKSIRWFSLFPYRAEGLRSFRFRPDRNSGIAAILQRRLGKHHDHLVNDFRHFGCAISPTTAAMSETVGTSQDPRVLSIQSHVVHGFVGNKCSVFVLQRLGLDVDPINTVHLSNHKRYPVCKGGVLQGNEIEELFSGLEANGLLDYSHVLTGYVGSPSVLVAIAKIVEKMKKSNPGLTFVCDPVLGDDGRLYVPEELAAIYKDSIVGLSDVLTPNQTELELLTEEKIKTQEDVLRVCENLHARGPHTIVVTSVNLGAADPDAPITVIASTKRPQAAGHPSRMKFQIQKIPGYFGGTGDVFTSLLLARLSKAPQKLDEVVGKTLGTLSGVLKATCGSDGKGPFSNATDARSCNERELRLVQCQDLLVDPIKTVEAIPLD